MLRQAASTYVARLSTKAHFLPGAAECVTELARRASLCLVTNGLSRVQRGRLAHSGIAGRFTAILVSEELGLAKPDPRFFHAAAAALRLPPGQLLCVGDSPAADIAGARAAGIDACWFAPSGAPWPGPGEPPRTRSARCRRCFASWTLGIDSAILRPYQYEHCAATHNTLSERRMP